MKNDRTRERFESEFERIFGETYPDAWTEFTHEPRCGHELPWCGTSATRSPLVREGEIDCADPETLGFSSDLPQYQPMVVRGYETLGNATVQVRVDDAFAAVMSCEPCVEFWMRGFGLNPQNSMLSIDFPAGTYGIYLVSRPDGTPYLSLTE